jgi:Uma2 family endonuclease
MLTGTICKVIGFRDFGFVVTALAVLSRTAKAVTTYHYLTIYTLEAPMLALKNRIEIVERMTATEFFELAPETETAELVEGVMIVSPPPLDSHERQQGFLYTLIRLYVEQHNLGEVRGSRTAVRLSEAHVFEPDILFLSQARSHLLQERGVFGAPDLVVEILSAATAAYDRGDKLRAYERYGVQETWLIDPYGPSGTLFYQQREGLYVPMPVDGEGWLVSTALPGFHLQTDWLWPQEKFVPVFTALAAVNERTGG